MSRLVMFAVDHPQGKSMQVRSQYRKHILECKRKWGTARSLLHYRNFIETYLWTKS